MFLLNLLIAVVHRYFLAALNCRHGALCKFVNIHNTRLLYKN